MILETQIQQLSNLVDSLGKAATVQEKLAILKNAPYVQEELAKRKISFPSKKIAEEKAYLSILAIGQGSTLFNNAPPPSRLLRCLVEIDRFFESIGGIVGYHLKALILIHQGEKRKNAGHFSRAEGIDLTKSSPSVKQAIYAGIQALPSMAEVYPIGGLGTRLNLKMRNGEPLPAACLPFCGKSLLEGLIRDVQGREYLYYKLYHAQVTVPLAMMTSNQKDNHFHIERICKKNEWFGRPQGSFFLFSQLSVPVVTEEGNWSMLAPGELNLHPGGHGALWRMADERGVFHWLLNQGKESLLIRQINNPIAGVDFGLLALVGRGKLEDRVFGFASCERVVNAAEGILVLVEQEDGYRTISNIEYTDFDAFGIEDRPARDGFSLYPANTNILYANLKKILPKIRSNPLPGLILNMKTAVPYLSWNGEKKEVRGGRLESMMQNIADSLLDPKKEPLRTFLTYNERRKTISTAKSSYEPGKRLLETPEGAFYDLLSNGHDLLKNRCGFDIPDFSSSEDYLKKGPSLLFLYHPALGPLYEIICQKIRGGKIAYSSELQLEIAEFDCEELDLEGSLCIKATSLLGHLQDGMICYSEKSGKCCLKKVTVRNRGIDKEAQHCYWKNEIRRKESLNIILHGSAEFHAENIAFPGTMTIEVPSAERWTAIQEADGNIIFLKERLREPTWYWKYEYSEKGIQLRQEITTLVLA